MVGRRPTRDGCRRYLVRPGGGYLRGGRHPEPQEGSGCLVTSCRSCTPAAGAHWSLPSWRRPPPTGGRRATGGPGRCTRPCRRPAPVGAGLAPVGHLLLGEVAIRSGRTNVVHAGPGAGGDQTREGEHGDGGADGDAGDPVHRLFLLDVGARRSGSSPSLGSRGISGPPARYRAGINPIDRPPPRSHTREMRRLRVLGPLEVDGAAEVLGPRDRVVVSALALRPGERVDAETLAEALWGEEPPASAAKVVQGCVSRLRKALGAGAIETVDGGYRVCSRRARHRPAAVRGPGRAGPRVPGHPHPGARDPAADRCARPVARSGLRRAGGLDAGTPRGRPPRPAAAGRRGGPPAGAARLR